MMVFYFLVGRSNGFVVYLVGDGLSEGDQKLNLPRAKGYLVYPDEELGYYPVH